jgi:hypothetical protein
MINAALRVYRKFGYEDVEGMKAKYTDQLGEFVKFLEGLPKGDLIFYCSAALFLITWVLQERGITIPDDVDEIETSSDKS